MNSGAEHVHYSYSSLIITCLTDTECVMFMVCCRVKRMILSQTSLWISLLKRLLIYIPFCFISVIVDFGTFTFFLGLKYGSLKSPNRRPSWNYQVIQVNLSIMAVVYIMIYFWVQFQNEMVDSFLRPDQWLGKKPKTTDISEWLCYLFFCSVIDLPLVDYLTNQPDCQLSTRMSLSSHS